MEAQVKDAYWFQHDSNAQHDERVLELRAEYGWEGYGIFWALVEKMRESPDYRLSMATLGGLAAGMGILKPLLTGVINLACQHGLFALEQESAYFYSPSLRRRMTQWDEKKSALSEAGKRGAERKAALKEAAALAQKQRELEATLKPPLSDPGTFVSTVHNSTVEKNTKEEGRQEGPSGQPAALALPSESKKQTTGHKEGAAAKPREYAYDEAPVFAQSEFFAHLKKVGYDHVDKGMYLLQIQEVGRKKMITTTDEKWRDFITSFLNNHKRDGKLILPEPPAGPIQQPYRNPNGYGPAPTSTVMSGSIQDRILAQSKATYL